MRNARARAQGKKPRFLESFATANFQTAKAETAALTLTQTLPCHSLPHRGLQRLAQHSTILIFMATGTHPFQCSIMFFPSFFAERASSESWLKEQRCCACLQPQCCVPPENEPNTSVTHVFHACD